MIHSPRPAASLILMRDRRAAPPDLLVVRRGSTLAFAGGAYAFPGGRVDEADQHVAARTGLADAEDAAARVAAIRETIEETGLWIAVEPPPAADLGHREGGLARWLATSGARLRTDALLPFARWLPGEEAAHRRFDTRFYIAAAEEAETALPVADGTETAESFWASAAEVLARVEAGDGHVIFPTRRLLERLARFASFADARAEAERLPQRIITPWTEQRADGPWLCIPPDAGYPVCAERFDTAMRG